MLKSAHIACFLLAAVIGWRCWNNETPGGVQETTVIFDSSSHSWDDLPATGWQVMMLYYDDNSDRRILYSNDFYWQCRSEEHPDGFCQGMADPTGSRKLGVTISDEEFARILAEAWASRTAPE